MARIGKPLLFILTLAAGAAWADTGWTGYGAVQELTATSRHYYLVRLDVGRNPSGCSDQQWFYQDYGAPGADKMYVSLLEAVKSGLRLRVYVTGRCNLDGYAEISSVSISP